MEPQTAHASNPLRARERLLAFGIMGAIALHAVLGFALPRLPAWKMFMRWETYSYDIVDRHGKAVDLRNHVPARAYTVGCPRCIQSIGIWIAGTDPKRAPLKGTATFWPNREPVHMDVSIENLDGEVRFRMETREGEPPGESMRRASLP